MNLFDDLQTEVGEDEHIEEEVNADVERELARLRARAEAQRLFAAEGAGAGWKAPWDGQPALLSEQIDQERPNQPWLVERLFGWSHNIVLAAQHGSGKTTLGQNLARSIVDGKPFLDREVTPINGRLGWINGEMDQWDWMDYIRPMKVRNLNRIAAMHLRDSRLPLTNPLARDAMSEWCVANEVEVLVFDSWRRLCAWSGLDENVNADVEQMTMVIDEVKKQAGVHACLILAHTGRAKAEEGEERVRGATALDDWSDGRWVMIKQREQDGGARLFWGEKRGIEMPETALLFNQLSHRITLGEGNRHAAAARAREDELVIALSQSEKGYMSTGEIAKALRYGNDTSKAQRVIDGLVKRDAICKTEKQPANGTWWTLRQG